MYIDNNSKIKGISIVCLVFQIITLIIIYNNPATGYELSIYSNIPILAYVLLSLSIFGGFYIVLFDLSNNSRLTLLGFIILIFGFFIMIGLPIVKSYQFYGYADVLTHFSIEKDIVEYHTFSKDNFYPIMHVLFSNISLISGISLITISKFFTPLFSLLFIVFIYLFSSSIFADKQKMIITSSLAVIPILSTYYAQAVPNGISLMLVPLILYLYFKEKSYADSVLLIIFLMLIPFSHPLTSIILLIYISAIEISKKVYSHFKGKESKVSFNSFLILLVSFFTWISTSIMFGRSVNMFYSWTRGELYAPTYQIAESFNKLNLNMFERIFLFVKMYSPQLFLIALSLIATLVILKKLNSKSENSDEKIFAILACLIVNIGISFLFLFTGDPDFRAIRSLSFVFMLLIPLAGYGLYELIKRTRKLSLRKYKIVNIFILCILTSSFLFGLMSLYPSPYILQPSQHVSTSHLKGMEWFYENKDLDTMSVRLESSTPWRFGEFIYGKNISEKRKDIYRYEGWEVVPDNLGYKNVTYLGDNFNETKYFLLSSMDKKSYVEAWYRYGRYTQNDFEKLNNDLSADKIYSSNDLDIWILRNFLI